MQEQSLPGIPEENFSFEDLADAIQKDLEAVAEKHKINILSAVECKVMDNAGVFYSGNPNTVTQLGLAKIIENKFKE